MDKSLHGAKEGYIEGESKKREMKSERKIERDTHNLEREASTDHPLGEGFQSFTEFFFVRCRRYYVLNNSSKNNSLS